MANVLLAYTTGLGQTEKIARRIAQGLGAAGHTVELLDVKRSAPPPLDHFDVVVVGAPIHAGGYPRAIARFIRTHRQTLERVRAPFFSVGLAIASRTSDGRAQTLEVVEKLVRDTGFRPPRVELFAGALLYTQYNPLLRFVMRRITKKEGGDTDTSRDYEYTDWNAVDRFAKSLVPADAARAATASALEARG